MGAILKAISPPWEAARVGARSRLCWLACRPGWVRNSLHGWLCCLCVKEWRTERQKEESCGAAHLDTICTEHVTLNWLVEHHEGFWSAQWQAGGLSVLCLPAPAASFSLFHIEGHSYFGLSSFIKGSGVSESLWCFLSRGGSTLLQRVHEGERMYPPLAVIGWWEPAGKH